MLPSQLKQNITLQNNFVTVFNNPNTFINESNIFTDETKHESKQGVAAIPVTHDGSIVLIQQYYPKLNDFLYIIPQQNILSRNIENDARKVVSNTTGHSSEQTNYIQRIMHNPSVTNYCTHTFVLKGAFYNKSIPIEGSNGPFTFNIETVKEMMKNGKIIDTVSLIALNIYLRNLKNKK